jgi:predicted DsbA family dithiol-disulfide isomerase
VRLEWRPFLLRPQMPPEGLPIEQVLPPGYAEEANARLAAVTKEAGLPFVAPRWVPNTRLAHEAGAFAGAHGLGDPFHRAALRARFGEGRDLGDPAVLAEIGAGVGLDRGAMLAALRERTYRAEVEAALAEADVDGVPAFEFAPGAVLTGAQPYAVFQRVMNALGIAPR